MLVRRGFTLADVIVAIAILSVALLGVAQALSSAERFVVRVRAVVRGAFASREALARFARPDTVCLTASGTRALREVTLTWSQGALPGSRLVTVIARPDFPSVRPESAATVVACP